VPQVFGLQKTREEEDFHMNRLFIVAGLTCGLASPAIISAQSTAKPPSSSTSKPAAGQEQGTAKPATGQGATKSAAGTLPAAETTFVKEAAIGGMAEVEMGQLASTKAQSADVKQFGQRMVDDHGKANNELKSLASQKNVTLPAELDAKHKALRDKLEKMSGAEFDRAYMAEMVADHNKDVASFSREAKSGKDPELKAWAAKTLPTLQEHQKMAREINSKVGGAAKTSAAPKTEPKKQ
jgi:putative membrane protein